MLSASGLQGATNQELKARAPSSIAAHLPLLGVLYAVTGHGGPWALPFVLATVYRAYNLGTCPTAQAPSTEQASWRSRFSLGTYACAVLWSSLSASLILTGGQSWSTMFIFVVMSGLSCGAVTSLAPDYKIARNFLMLLDLPPFIVSLYSGIWSVVWVLILYKVFLLRQGRQQHEWFWKAFHDNQDLQNANAALLAAERAKSAFFANVSHELRTPLTLILGPLESLQVSLTDPAQKSLVRTVQRNGQHLHLMVNELLDFAKLQAHQFEVHRESLRIDHFCREIYEAFLPAATAAGQTLTFHAEDSSARSMDPGMLERILFNLLSNALKFTGKGGTVNVRVEIAGEDRLVLVVSDTGIGIPEHDQERIFAQFEQAESSSNRRYEGTGLGLAIVKQFCQLLGGEVSVSSVVGQGSTFRALVLAPTCREADTHDEGKERLAHSVARNLPEPFVDQPGSSEKPHILLAEDNDELAAYIIEVLKPYARVERASDGKDALNRVHLGSPRLIISDVMMPGMDGLELCQAVKKDPRLAGIPVMMLTASASRETMMQAWQAGANEFLLKPFHPVELITRIKNFLDGQDERARLEREREDLELSLRQLEKNAGLQRMGGGVAHSFNNLLSVLIGSVELVRLEENLTEAIEEHLDQMDAALERATSITWSFMHYLNCVPCHREWVDLADLCQTEGSVAITRHLQSAPIVGDRARLEQLLESLLSNAVEAHHTQPAQIVLSTGQQEFANGFSREVSAGTWCFMKVQDGGCGMDEKTRARMLDPFFSTKFTGRGLGLSVLAGVLQSHQAHLHVESAPENGTILWVLFPAAPKQRPQPQ